MDWIKRLRAIKAESTKLSTEAGDMLTLATTESRKPTDEETTRESEIDTRLAEIKAEETRISAQIERARESARQSFANDPEPAQHVTAVHNNEADRPWESMGEFLMAVVAAEHRGSIVDPRLMQFDAAALGMGSNTGADGGFLVETDFSTRLMDRAEEESVLLPMCDRIPIGPNADGIELPYIDETSRANGSRWGGVEVFWRAEGSTVTATKPKLAKIQLQLEDLMGIAYMTNRLLQDATAMEAVVLRGFGSEFGFKIDDGIIRGTGAGQLAGFINGGNGSLVTVSKETGQSADTLVFENVSKMRSRFWAKSRPSSVWLINQALEPEMENMTITVGTGGQPVYMPAGGVSVDGFDRLYGRPVIPIEQASAPGDLGDIMLVDLSQYLIIEKGGLKSDTSIHVRFLQDEMTFRFIMRINGQPSWRTPLTPFKDGGTQSPFVTLQAR